MTSRVEIEGGQVIEFRQIKPVKVSTLHQKAERYRDGFVKLFREYEGADLLNEDGTPMLDGAGRRLSLTAGRFAREMGINKSTFHYWLNGRPEPEMGSHSERTDDEGWDLPGVPQETVEKIRETVERELRPEVEERFEAAIAHNEALLADPEWGEANGMEPVEDEIPADETVLWDRAHGALSFRARKPGGDV